MRHIWQIVTKAFIVAIFLTLLASLIAYAAIPAPNTDPVISSIEAYRNVIETDDQLHIITFDLDIYTTNPAEGADDAWLFRFLDDGVEIASVAPYAYHDDGYDQGVVSFYFDSSDPDLPTWQSANLDIELVGNPSLEWAAGDPPSVTNDNWQSWTDGTGTIAARIRVLATQLESAWGIDLIEQLQGVNKLTSNGEDYFETAISNLRVIAPDVFSALMVTPDFPSANFTQSRATSTEARWSGNTTFDLTETADLAGVSRIWWTSALYIILCVGILIVSSMRMGQPGAPAYRPATFLFGALMVVGSFMGFMVFEAAVFCGVAGGLATVYSLFWRGSV